MSRKTYTFHVEGMHCAACEFLLEEKGKALAGMSEIHANLKDHTLTVSGEILGHPGEVAKQLTALVANDGYRVLLEKEGDKRGTWREIVIALPFVMLFLGAFWLLQHSGFSKILSFGNVTYGSAFLVGLVASVSTCLAVVGGLVLSFSANAARNRGSLRAQFFFHGGRLLGFFLLGGVIGILGGMVQLSVVGNALLNIAVAGVMIILGVNLLDLFIGLERFQIRMPKIFAKQALRMSASAHVLAPFLGGVVTFFLPCGFTQSMQIYALSTGSFIRGGLTMFFFALGTLPVLSLLSLSSLSMLRTPWKGIFFKAVGMIILIFALLNLWNAITLLSL